MGGSNPERPDRSKQNDDGNRTPPKGPPCPETISTTLNSSNVAVTAGDLVQARLADSAGIPIVEVVLSQSSVLIGTLTGVPRLAALIRCMQGGEVYSGQVDRVHNGAIYVTLLQR